MPRNLKECDVYTRRRRIASLAEDNPEMGFTSLHHLIDLDWLVEAWHKTRKGGTPGIDGQTADQYEQNLMQNLQNLLERFRSGRYKAPPVLRKHIPKGSGTETRPIGIPDTGGQGTATRRRNAYRADLRARFLRWKLWIPSATRCARRTAGCAEYDQAVWWRLGAGGRFAKVLRHIGPCPSPRTRPA